MNATVFETDPGTGNEIFNSTRYQHLARPGFIRNAHTHLGRGAGNVPVNNFTLAGV